MDPARERVLSFPPSRDGASSLGTYKAKERRELQIYSLEAWPLGGGRLPPWRRSRRALLLLTLLCVYLLCRGPLCAALGPGTHPLPCFFDAPQAIFDQYYKNQPTDFLREI